MTKAKSIPIKPWVVPDDSEYEVNADGFLVGSDGEVMTTRKLKPLPERRVVAKSHSGSGDVGHGTDWYSDKLTPPHLKPVRNYVETPMAAPVEVDPVQEAKDKEKVQEPAIHMTLLERFIKETEGT